MENLTTASLKVKMCKECMQKMAANAERAADLQQGQALRCGSCSERQELEDGSTRSLCSHFQMLWEPDRTSSVPFAESVEAAVVTALSTLVHHIVIRFDQWVDWFSSVCFSLLKTLSSRWPHDGSLATFYPLTCSHTGVGRAKGESCDEKCCEWQSREVQNGNITWDWGPSKTPLKELPRPCPLLWLLMFWP